MGVQTHTLTRTWKKDIAPGMVRKPAFSSLWLDHSSWWTEWQETQRNEQESGLSLKSQCGIESGCFVYYRVALSKLIPLSLGFLVAKWRKKHLAWKIVWESKQKQPNAHFLPFFFWEGAWGQHHRPGPWSSERLVHSAMSCTLGAAGVVLHQHALQDTCLN